MKKIIMISLGLSLTAFGMSYKEFKKYTQKNAKVLQSQALSLQTTQEENNILLRTKNPTLEIEASRFNPNGGDTSIQYSGTVSQSIRTANYYAALEDKTSALSLLQEAYILDGKAGYIRELEMLYTQYVYQYKLLYLLEDEYKLSKKVTNIVKERYDNGSENKVAYLQAKTDSIALKTQMFTSRQEAQIIYYKLLSIAGLTKKVSLEKKFIYAISSKMSPDLKINSKQRILDAKTKLLKSEVRMNEGLIDTYELATGIENEPEQSILRFGISIPLPVFNNKSEEKQLAKLQMQQLSLDNEQLGINMYTQKEMRKSSIRELSSQYATLQTLKSEQNDLNDLLQEGYKIAQGSIFMMMNAKNKLIQTQKLLLQTQKMINTQKIELRFLQGHYND